MTNSASSSPSAGPLPTLAATACVAALACAALYQATLGFQVVSTEDGRRLAIAGAPRAIPPAQLDLPGSPALAALLRADGRATIVSFIYTRCNAVCSVLGSEFQQLQQRIRAQGLLGKVRLLSISFDARDDAGRLAAYAAHQHADPAVWTFAGIPLASQRQAVLDTFGIVVVPAPAGAFVHNAALHIVGPDGRLARVDDVDNPDQALADAAALYAQARR